MTGISPSESSSHLLALRDAFGINLVGGKAVNLAQLMQAGLPVPDGFVVTTDAFCSARNGRVSSILATSIREALRPFSGKRMVVRSSATAEDMVGASMAGQYDTFLNLDSADEVIAAIEKCWRSIQSDHAQAYLNEHSIKSSDVAMAVVVQQQVAAAVAGVLFTVDPRTGSREHMLIEASWGLGDSLVSGDVQPDVIRISSSDTRVCSYEVADKQHAIYAGGDGLEPVAEHFRERACLDYQQLMRLQKLGRLADVHFGAPQDIEWAIEDGEVRMLQARPITTLDETDAYNALVDSAKSYLNERVAEGRGPWVRHNLGETLPHPTPLTWSLISEFMSGSGGFGKMYEMLGFSPGSAVKERSFLDLIGGEIYMDCSLMTEMFCEDYPFAYDPQLLRDDPDAAQSPPSVPTGSLGELGQAAQLGNTAAGKIKELAATCDQKFDQKYVPQVLEWSAEQESLTLAELDDRALAELWQSQVQQVLGEFGAMAFLPSMIEAVAVENLRQIIDEHIWDEEPDELVATLSVSHQPDCTISGNIALGKLAAGEITIEGWLETYGHRAPSEFDLSSPRWHERPEAVLQLAGQLSSDVNLEAIHQQRMQDADVCLANLKKKLPQDAFEALAMASDQVRRYLRFREDGKFYLMRAYSVLRRTALEVGRRLNIGEGIFFLQSEEMLPSLKSGYVPKDKIQARQLTYQVESRLPLPHVIESGDVAHIGAVIVRSEEDALDAHSVSSGSASGTTQVVLSPNDCAHFEAGAILVCPSTDPSWTPLFTKASGLVLERGGSLSHGAVVAREMGLPAVVLDGATELFASGEIITVDANAGRIYRKDAEVPDLEATDSKIERSSMPPTSSVHEGKVNRLGLIMALLWGALLGAVFLLPPQILHDPFMAGLDVLIWPLIRNFGMITTVAIIAGIFGLVPILGQRFLTDNARLYEAKYRAGLLRKAAGKLPAKSARRKAMESLAAPVTTRILKASMVPLACILGPMIMVFMWFPMRVDPASWSAEPGRMVSIVVEVDGECQDVVSLSVTEPLTLESMSPSEQTLPPIRSELEELREEWKAGSDLSDLPWEVQSAGDHARVTMLASLNTYLKNGVPPQTLTWMIAVPESAGGAFATQLKVGERVAAEFDLIFGQSVPPAALVEPVDASVVSVSVNYPRALHQPKFCLLAGTNWDMGWLGIYLLAYLPTMFIAKMVLRVP